MYGIYTKSINVETFTFTVYVIEQNVSHVSCVSNRC